MNRRRLHPEELDLWRRVARTTERLRPGDIKREFERQIGAKPEASAPEAFKPDPFEIGVKASRHPYQRDLPRLPETSRSAVNMDKKAYGKLRRGKLMPEARLDLHGMTMSQAQPALTGFILRAQADGKRLVLVITGKGRGRDHGGPIPERPGILRRNVPQWLSMPPLGQAVLQISPAHVKHGGGGAYYVYLRRRR